LHIPSSWARKGVNGKDLELGSPQACKSQSLTVEPCGRCVEPGRGLTHHRRDRSEAASAIDRSEPVDVVRFKAVLLGDIDE
jgi:hypothetical protein